MSPAASQFILFGASMTEWSFDEGTEGFGWFLAKAYRDKVAVVNEARGCVPNYQAAAALRLLACAMPTSMNHSSRFVSKRWRKRGSKMEHIPSYAQVPHLILFGDSLTEWAFDEHNEGFGWDLKQKYGEKVKVQCEGQAGYTSTRLLPDFDRVIAQATAPNAPRTLLFTIFLGANDACFIGETEYVPLPTFEANIRKFVETILVQDAMAETKIVLITPPPINIPSPDAKDKDENEIRDANQAKREMRGYKTYMSKKRYAERIMQIAREYEETGRVIGLDFWGDLIRARLQDFEEDYNENKLPGSGLYGVQDFGEGYFTDGLHLDKKGYNVLSRGLYDAVLSKWPELSPGQL